MQLPSSSWLSVTVLGLFFMKVNLMSSFIGVGGRLELAACSTLDLVAHSTGCYSFSKPVGLL